MIVLGLTGSIGMGKSTAADMLRQMGVPVHDSDAVVHAMMIPGGPAIPALASLFPEAYDADRKTIDRAMIGQIVFCDDEKRKALEAIVHPMVRQSRQDFLRENSARGEKVVVLDIPLLYETGAQDRVDKVIVVTAPAFIQKKRVLARPNMTMEKFTGILRSQTPDAEKRARADYVVQTGFGRAWTEAALKKIIKDLRA